MPNDPMQDDDDDDSGGGEEWLATFADMSTLLLCFFVLLLSMSTMDKQKFSESFSSVRDSFGGNAQKAIQDNNATTAVDQTEEKIRSRKDLLEEQKKTFHELRTLMTTQGLENVMSAVLDEGIITLRLPAEALFEPSSERLTPNGVAVLKGLRTMLIKVREQDIDIRGYTDDSPIPSTARFKDNWELSALRAVNVLRDLLAGGIEAFRVTATGLGDMNPLAPNTTPENRAMNRRVEFILERRVTNED